MTEPFKVPAPSREAVDDLRDTKLRGHSFDEVRAMVALVYRRDLSALCRQEAERAWRWFMGFDPDGDTPLEASFIDYLAARYGRFPEAAPKMNGPLVTPQPSAEPQERYRVHFDNADGFREDQRWWVYKGAAGPYGVSFAEEAEARRVCKALNEMDDYLATGCVTPSAGERCSVEEVIRMACVAAREAFPRSATEGADDDFEHRLREKVRARVPTPSAGETKPCEHGNVGGCAWCAVGARPEDETPEGRKRRGLPPHQKPPLGPRPAWLDCTACGCERCKAREEFVNLMADALGRNDTRSFSNRLDTYGGPMLEESARRVTA